MTPQQFVEKWSRVELPERAASQERFIDLCRMLSQRTTAEHDATGAEYAFEKGTAVKGAASLGSKGERGYADVWWNGKFALELQAQRQIQGPRRRLSPAPDVPRGAGQPAAVDVVSQ